MFLVFCSACKCNGHASMCNPNNGKCFCTTKGIKGDRCHLWVSLIHPTVFLSYLCKLTLSLQFLKFHSHASLLWLSLYFCVHLSIICGTSDTTCSDFDGACDASHKQLVINHNVFIKFNTQIVPMPLDIHTKGGTYWPIKGTIWW